MTEPQKTMKEINRKERQLSVSLFNRWVELMYAPGRITIDDDGYLEAVIETDRLERDSPPFTGITRGDLAPPANNRACRTRSPR